ncbi:hypothetical protein ACFZDK_05205 [Streptomyces sp. NPDC007901]
MSRPRVASADVRDHGAQEVQDDTDRRRDAGRVRKLTARPWLDLIALA